MISVVLVGHIIYDGVLFIKKKKNIFAGFFFFVNTSDDVALNRLHMSISVFFFFFQISRAAGYVCVRRTFHDNAFTGKH